MIRAIMPTIISHPGEDGTGVWSICYIDAADGKWHIGFNSKTRMEVEEHLQRDIWAMPICVDLRTSYYWCMDDFNFDIAPFEKAIYETVQHAFNTDVTKPYDQRLVGED